IRSSAEWVDIINPRVNKGSAIRALQQSLGVDPEQTIVFGDLVGCGFASGQLLGGFLVEVGQAEVVEHAFHVDVDPHRFGAVVQQLGVVVAGCAEDDLPHVVGFPDELTARIGRREGSRSAETTH
ncbi:MAG: HAD family hydrolase, partial [Propioniciclava sp.]